MKVYKSFWRMFLAAIVVSAVIFSGVRIYINQEKHLDSIAEQKKNVESQLCSAKSRYENILMLEQESNTQESKENQIRERLNMIKGDEIQFLFSRQD